MSNEIESIVKNVLASLSNDNNSNLNLSQAASQSSVRTNGNKLTAADYPLSEKRKDLIKTPSNKTLDEITLEAVLSNKIQSNDLRITAETLELQAQVAESAQRKAFALNLRRAAELTRIPDDRILEIYNALRPNRSTKAELLSIADELKNKYQAVITSAFVAEAAEVYERRDVLVK